MADTSQCNVITCSIKFDFSSDKCFENRLGFRHLPSIVWWTVFGGLRLWNRVFFHRHQSYETYKKHHTGIHLNKNQYYKTIIQVKNAITAHLTNSSML